MNEMFLVKRNHMMPYEVLKFTISFKDKELHLMAKAELSFISMYFEISFLK